jgi:hypothetical protein
MKDLIENQKLTIQDFDIISELSTFVAKGTSYEADEGSHDDLVMCLVLFGWLTNQTFFSDVTNTNIKDKLYKDKMQAIEDETLPLPISSNDPMFDPLDGGFVEGGSLWHVVRP